MITARARQAGWICLIGSGVGIVQGLLLMLLPPVSSPDRYSYPLSPIGHVIAEASFAVQHVLLLVGVVTLARAQRGRATVVPRIGLWVGAAGLALLTIVELIAMTAADVAADSAYAATVSSLYAIPTLTTGAGLVVGGLGFLRSGTLPGGIIPRGWRRWVPLIIGGYVFVPLLPAIMAPFLFGRLAIMGWMITFALLGWMLIKPGEHAQESLDKISSRTLPASA